MLEYNVFAFCFVVWTKKSSSIFAEELRYSKARASEKQKFKINLRNLVALKTVLVSIISIDQSFIGCRSDSLLVLMIVGFDNLLNHQENIVSKLKLNFIFEVTQSKTFWVNFSYIYAKNNFFSKNFAL